MTNFRTAKFKDRERLGGEQFCFKRVKGNGGNNLNNFTKELIKIK